MTIYQQEMLRKLGQLGYAGQYDEKKGLLVIWEALDERKQGA